MAVALHNQIHFDPDHAEEILAKLPASRAVFLLLPHDATAAEPYLSRTSDLRRRLSRLLQPPPKPTKAISLREFTHYIAYQETGSEFETAFLHYRLARELFPRDYRTRLRVKPPALLKINLRHPWPRCYVTRWLAEDFSPANGGASRPDALYFGPFPHVLTARRFADEFLNFFKIRRCCLRITPDPNFPGCIYSEMKMCLGPCFASCTREEYARELDRVIAFLSTEGKSLHDELASARDATTNTLEFERAARLHTRLEKLEGALRVKGELARPLEALNAVILQPGAAPQAVELYRVSAGAIAHAGTVSFAALARQPVSLEIILRDLLEAVPIPALDPRDRSEHLWLLTRWFYSKPRTGEILFLEPGQLPYRKLIRLCGKILQGTQKPLLFIPPEPQ